MAAPLLETPLGRTKGVVMTSTERARNFKERRKAEGITQFNVWLPQSQHSELWALIDALKANPDMRVCSISLQDAKTGRMKGVKLR